MLPLRVEPSITDEGVSLTLSMSSEKLGSDPILGITGPTAYDEGTTLLCDLWGTAAFGLFVLAPSLVCESCSVSDLSGSLPILQQVGSRER